MAFQLVRSGIAFLIGLARVPCLPLGFRTVHSIRQKSNIKRIERDMEDMMKRITPRDASKMTVRELRSALGKMNKEARNRIARLEKAGYGETVAGSKSIQPIRGMRKADLISAISDVSLFLSSSRSKVTRLKSTERKTLRTLHDRGFDMVNAGNLRAFGRFMDDIKSRQGKLRVDSGTVARIFGEMEKKNIPTDKFEEAFGRYLNDEKGLLDVEKAISGEMIKDGRTSAAKIRGAMKGFGWI